MKRLILSLAFIGIILTASANTLWWGSAPNTVLDETGAFVPTSKTDGTVGAFAQLIWIGLDGNVDDFMYSGTGVSGDDQVIAVSYSYGGSGLGDKSGQFKFVDSGLDESKEVYARVYNAANPSYGNGTNAVITGSSISHYWQSSTYNFAWSDTAPNDEWNFTGGMDVQTTTAVPEPATFLMFALGGFGAWMIRRKNRSFFNK